MNRLALCFVLLVGLLHPLPMRAADTAGARFGDKARVGDVELPLNGAGLRSMFVIRIYALGLYLPQPTRDAQQAIVMPGPKRIRLETLREVDAERFLDGLHKGLEKNHDDAALAALRERMAQFAAQVRAVAPLAKGAVVTLDLLPGGATRVALDGRPLGRDIPGEDFHQALLRIWLGPRPAQDDLKAALLGG